MGRRRHKEINSVSNHNSGQWFRVVEFTTMYGRIKDHHDLRGRQYPPGWYVIRTCPCHAGLPVTRCYATEKRAAQVMQLMIETAMALGT